MCQAELVEEINVILENYMKDGFITFFSLLDVEKFT